MIALLFVTAVSILSCKDDVKTLSTPVEKSSTQSKNVTSTSATDVFGIRHINTSAASGLEWNSNHWSVGPQRSFTYGQTDFLENPNDPNRRWSRPRGNTALYTITGAAPNNNVEAGVLRMGGKYPRMYIQSNDNNNPLTFRDTEFTAYFKRIGTDGNDFSGLMMGTRAGVNGHDLNDKCNASTYYLSVRRTGEWLFYKELVHPDGANSVIRGWVFPSKARLESDVWYGVKFLVYNVPNTNHVKLEAWVELNSNGNPTSSAAVWRKVGEMVDGGNWIAPVGDCNIPGDTIINPGKGTPFIRNNEVGEARYKMVSVREITATRAPL